MEPESLFSAKPLLAILVSAVGALLIARTGESRANLREFWSVAAGVLKLVIVASMIPDIQAGRTLQFVLFRILPGIELAFRVDAFGLLFALGASILWIATSFYSIGYMRSLKEQAQTRYFACFCLALSATMGVAFSANLFTLFLFYEALTLATYPLVGHKETPEAKAGALKYIIYLLGAAKVLLVARHADAQLAPSRHGGPYPGQCAPACRGRSEDRGLRHTPGLPVRFWLRRDAATRSGQTGVGCCLSNDSWRLAFGPQPGQPEGPAGLLDD